MAALLLTRELSPPSHRSVVTPAPPPIDTKTKETEDIVYEPWDQVST